MRSKKQQNRRQMILAAVVALSAIGLATVNGAGRLAQSWDDTSAFYEQDHDALYGPLSVHAAPQEKAVQSSSASDQDDRNEKEILRLGTLKKQLARSERTMELLEKKITRVETNVKTFTKKLATIQDDERATLLRKRVALYQATLEDLRQDKTDLLVDQQDLREEIAILSEGL